MRNIEENTVVTGVPLNIIRHYMFSEFIFRILNIKVIPENLEQFIKIIPLQIIIYFYKVIAT